MHPHIINASLQVVPIVQDKHPYIWVDEVIELIKKSGLRYWVGPFGTTVEGKYETIRELIDEINADLLLKKCPEWLLNVQWHFRSEEDITVEEKIEKHV